MTIDPQRSDLIAVDALPGRSLSSKAVRFLGFAGLVGFVGLVLISILTPWIAPADPGLQDLNNRFAPPFWADGGSLERPLGTDQLGRDVLSRIMYGSRVSLLIGGGAVIIAGLFGTTLGLVAGFSSGFGGRLGTLIDKIINSAAEIALAIPGILLAIAVASVFGTSIIILIMILALFGWVVFARLARGILLSLHRRAFVEAAVILGASRRRVVMKHMLPEVIPQLLVVIPLQFGFMILVESALSYLGLGVQPPTPTWGRMVAESRTFLGATPWPALFSGLAITFTVLSVNFMTDLQRNRLSDR